MVNEDIITALKNSIERGESLQAAMDILINSGYNPTEVKEASRFVSGVSFDMNAKPNEELIMPSKRSLFSFKPKPILNQNQFLQNPIQSQNQSVFQKSFSQQDINQIKKEISPSLNSSPIQSSQRNISTYSASFSQNRNQQSLSSQLNKIAPPKQSYLKEIILLIILLVLITSLIATLWFKPQILSFFSTYFG